MYKMPLTRFSFAAVLAAVLLLPACEKSLAGPNAIQGNANFEAGHSLRSEAAAGSKSVRSVEKGISGEPVMMWTDPSPQETESTKVRNTDDQFEFKMNVVTQQPVKTTNIKVKVNGVLLEGAKINEEDLSPPLSPQWGRSSHHGQFQGQQYG